MTFPAAQIALLINGKIEGDPNATVNSFGKIEEAKEGQLTFLANPKYEELFIHTKASVIIINDAYELKQPVNSHTDPGTRCLFCFCHTAEQIPGNHAATTDWYPATWLYF